MTHVYFGQEPTYTKEQVKEKFKGVRCLRIETNEDGFVTSVSFRRPCIVCGVYHHRGSRPEMICGMKLMGLVRDVINREDEEPCDRDTGCGGISCESCDRIREEY